MAINIYILRLEQGKYYIGKSENPMKRFQQHLDGNGSSWTKKYKPLSVIRIISNASNFDEDKYTKEYMAKYGIENVRGGSYVEVDLDDFQIETLKREIWSAQNKCSRCGRSGHFIKECLAQNDIDGYEIDDESDYTVWCCDNCDREFETEKACIIHESLCNRKNIGHMVISHVKTNISKSKNGNNTCYRCGRAGHYSIDCYARTNIKGYYLDSDSE